MNEASSAKPLNGFTIDPATPADADTLVGLARAFYAESDMAFPAASEAALRAVAAGEPMARGWVICDDGGGAAVGYAVLTLGFAIEYGGRDGFLDDLYLAPAARGRGVGGRVLEAVDAAARELGVRALHLEVGQANDRAWALYRRWGFAESGRRLMTRRLA